MRFSATRRLRFRWALAALAVCSLAVTACSSGSLGSSSGKKGAVTLSFMVGNTEQAIKTAQQLAKDFHAANPNITIKLDIGPGGTELDNLVKTRLSTGAMDDVLLYNSGSLFQQINPQKSLLPVTNEPFMNNVADQFIPNVKAGNDVYGVPLGTVGGGGIFYNRKVYARLGLQVPKTWAQFMANNAKLKAAGVAPVVQTFGDTWTSQIFVLADFHNVAATEPDFVQRYTTTRPSTPPTRPRSRASSDCRRSTTPAT